ncbi:MAG: TIM-barrel domain-containing protein [bacterium]
MKHNRRILSKIFCLAVQRLQLKKQVFLVVMPCWFLSLAFAQETVIKNSKLTLEIQKNPFTMIFKDAQGKILTESTAPTEHPQVLFGLKRNGQWSRVTHLTEMNQQEGKYIFKGITQSGTSVEIVITQESSITKIEMKAPDDIEALGYSFHAYPDEHFSGLGQRFNSLNLRGQEIPTYDQRWTVPIPFFISSRGYGIYAKTNGKFTFDFCTRESSAYSFWVEQPILSFYFIYGATPKDIIRLYTAMTGRMMKPPSWEFGVWKWRDWVFDETEVYQDATMLKSLDIPASVIFIDSPWSNEYIDYEFNPKQFPNPKKMIDDLHEMGYRVLLWMLPFVNPAAKNYKEADEKGYFVKDSTGQTYQIAWWIPSGSKEIGLTTNGKGGMIDFTNPDAVKWWQNQIAKVVDLGIDGFKMDDCDPYILPDDAYLFNGKRGFEMKHYPLLYNKAVYELMEERRHGDFVLIPRAGSAGSQKYVPAFWAADQSPDFDFKTGLPSVIRGGQSIGLVGFPFWGSDVGGYRWAPTKEVFARWIQFGAFSPIMEVGGKSYHEPWMFDDEVERLFRAYAQLHTYLFPYISHYAEVALKDGTPIMRPLFLEFPEDQQAYKEEFEYMFGGELLAAPVYQPGTSRSVYLPKGKWMDFWSHKITKGPTTIISYPAPLDKIPLFVRVSNEAVLRLYRPLLFEQLKGLEERIQYVLRGTKKILLVKPAQRLRDQMENFSRFIATESEAVNKQAFRDFFTAIEAFKTFLAEEKEKGEVPYHVFQTLTERLDAIKLSLTAIKILQN